MTGEEAVATMIDALDALAIPYMLAGSFSSNYYGVPRATRDADFVIQTENVAVAELARRLGPAFQFDPQMSFETVTGTGRYVVKLRDQPFKIELFLLSDDPHDTERFNRRRRTTYLKKELHIPTAEDVVVTKLRWSRQGKRLKDADDVRNVIALQGDRLDWPYIEHWCDQHGTRALLDEIRRSIPPL